MGKYADHGVLKIVLCEGGLASEPQTRDDVRLLTVFDLVFDERCRSTPALRYCTWHPTLREIHLLSIGALSGLTSTLLLQPCTSLHLACVAHPHEAPPVDLIKTRLQQGDAPLGKK